jgi:5S rRNA maturation endonuclease (ribonuclease M5)
MTNTFTKLTHPKAGIATERYIYNNRDGDPVLIANRFDKSDGDKFFMPFDVIRGEWKAPDTRPLYRLPELYTANSDRVVILTEGEKCADALVGLGYIATTTFGGANASRKSDLSPLKGCNVIIWPDHDEPGAKFARQVTDTLYKDFETSAKTVPITADILYSIDNEKSQDAKGTPLPIDKGWDAADAIARGWGTAQIDRLLSYAAPLEAANANVKPTAPQKETATPAPSNIEVWKTPEGEPYATWCWEGHFEHWPIASATFKKFLSFQHYQAKEKMLSQSALDDQRRTFEGQALFGGDIHPVFNRIGTLGRTLYLDLGCADWKAVAINSEGWQVIDHPPARFTRARSMQPLPMPATSGGDINLLRPFLNTANEADFQMLVAWLIGCFHPKGPYPILILNGEQGSAKSTTARVLRNLIDPANPIARSAPNSEQDLVIAAKHNHVLAFDNLSTIKPMMADAFCRIATGGGFGTRKLHTDSEEMLFSATRPCLLNGIPDLAGRPDLADRAIVVSLPVIAPTDRAFEGEFNKSLDAQMPLILAGLLDAVSTALANLGSVLLTERPRMADFAKWVSAAEPALGWTQGAFLEAYAANRESGDRMSVEGNPVGLAILKLVQDDVRWSGTMTELKTTLRNRYPLLTDDPYSFPRQENKLSAAIRRIIPPLRRMGVVISFDRRGHSGERTLRVESA